VRNCAWHCFAARVVSLALLLISPFDTQLFRLFPTITLICSESEDDDDEDDEEELQAELEKIKAERAAAQAKREVAEKEMQEETARGRAMKANPLNTIEENSSKVKRRWNDDVVFRNQARDEPEQKKRFINDTIRSDFHRSFLHKYIK
jgi:protein CWC15